MKAEEQARVLKRLRDRRFFWKGILVASLSGVSYGLFTAFLNWGMSVGVWEGWQAGGLSPFALTFIAGAVGSTLMYGFSALWSLVLSVLQGKLGDFFRTLRTLPGRNLAALALLSGPVAGTAYVIALQHAGAMVIPISGLCPAIGALLARLFYRQPLEGRTLVGMGVCFGASVMIAGESLGSGGNHLLLGVAMAFVAAFIWGLEGCVAGYNTVLVDYQIGITIRQCVGAMANGGVVLPLLSLLGGNEAGYAWRLLSEVAHDGGSMVLLAVSGFFAMYAYSLWYKGNSMCGAALGMACNASFAFWGPFFCWLILGLGVGAPGWDIPFVGWLSAVVMIVGIFIIAVDPRALLKRGDKHDAA